MESDGISGWCSGFANVLLHLQPKAISLEGLARQCNLNPSPSGLHSAV